jgi:subtilisin-like proprotein convertase family protein
MVADADPMAKLLAGQPFALLDHGRPVAFELALDELYLPTATPVKLRLLKVEAQPDPAGLLRLAESMEARTGTAPQLVLYAAGHPRTEAGRRILTEEVLIQVRDANAADRVADAADLRITSRPEYAPDHVIAEAKTAGVGSGLGAVARLSGQAGVVSVEPLLERQQMKRITIPNDPYFSLQWHLRNTGQGGGTAGNDAKPTTAWDTSKGTGVSIAVIDDGVQMTHPDLVANISVGNHFDWNDNDSDPSPDLDWDWHGTSVAGVAAARGGNGIGGSGAAPLSTIVGFRLIAGPTSDADEADAMTRHNSIVAIKNNSWGPPDDEPFQLGGAGTLVRNAIRNGALNGRGGRGTIYTWAAGNGREDGDQGNKDGYANLIHVFAIGALTNTGVPSSYSEFGSNLIVSAPSNGGTLGIMTTDLVGVDGYNDGNFFGEHEDASYTNDFGGTSSATPLASGIIALMLQANPELSWRDVKEILLRSSTKVTPASTGWVTRSSGDPALPQIQHHESFGGGRINGDAAVALAANWPTPRAAMVQDSDSHTYTPAAAIADNNATGVQTDFDYSGEPPLRVEHAEVTITATHQRRGNLEILLTSPSGTVSRLASVSVEDVDNSEGYPAWTFSSVRHWGEVSLGTWKVTVRDMSPGNTGTLQAVSIRLSGTDALPQDIVVEQPAGVDLESGISTVDFADVATDNPSTKNFVLKNIGDLPLGNLSATIVGPDAVDFGVTTAPPGSMNGSSMSTMSVQMAPLTEGPKEATLRITSDDPDEGTFDIELKGTGTRPVGFLSFAMPGMTVNETAGVVQIPVARVDGSFGAVTVTLTSTNGTAVAPGDYAAQTGTMVNFGDGVVTQDVPLPIVNSTTNEANETFNVLLSNPTNGVRLGTPIQIPITIIDSSALSPATDTAAPGLPTVSAPTEGAVIGLAGGGILAVTGTATDNKGVEKVELSLNGGSFAPVTLAVPVAPSTAYSTVVTPVTGPNTVRVKSTDYAGRVSAITTRNFKVTRPLVVNVDAALASATAGFSGSTFREVGKSFSITVTPKAPTTTPAVTPGALFRGWIIGGSDVANGNIPFTPARLGIVPSALQKQALTFIFREGLELTADLMPNPFAPLAGTYNGLVRPSATLPNRAPLGGGPGPEDGSTLANATEGRFTATVMNTGAFSGTLTIDGFALNVSGAFDESGDARFGSARLFTLAVPRTNKPSLTVALKINLAQPVNVPDKITGTVTATEFKQSVVKAVSVVDGDRAFYNGTTLMVDSHYLGANPNLTGMFTVRFPAKAVIAQTPGVAVVDYPQGDGIGTVTISKAGVVALSGVLADGTAVTATSALSETNAFPLFAQLYNKLGFLSGMVTLDKLMPDSDMTGPSLQWLRPFQGTVHYYPHGWVQGIRVDMLGAKYAVTLNQSVLKAAGGGVLSAADANGNATLTFSEGQLSETMDRILNLSAADVVAKIPANDVTFTMSIDRAKGTFKGTFSHTDDTVPAFTGVIYQKGVNAGGYGYFLTKQPAPITYTGQSGVVKLTGEP